MPVLPHAELEISPRFALKQGATRFARAPKQPYLRNK